MDAHSLTNVILRPIADRVELELVTNSDGTKDLVAVVATGEHARATIVVLKDVKSIEHPYLGGIDADN